MKKIILTLSIIIGTVFAKAQIVPKNETDVVISLCTIIKNNVQNKTYFAEYFGLQYDGRFFYRSVKDESHTSFKRFTFGPSKDGKYPIEIYVPEYDKQKIAFIVRESKWYEQNRSFDSLLNCNAIIKSDIFVSDTSLLLFEKSIISDNR